MKNSNYNIYIHKENNSLIYNSYTDNYLLISNKVCSLIEDNSHEILSTEFPKVYHKLIENGFLIEDDLDELGNIRFNHKNKSFNPMDYHMVIFPTQDCNLKCWYCYEGHVKNSIISDEVIENILKFIENKTNSTLNSLLVTFFGGEPLLYFDKVYILLKGIAKICNRKNIPFYPFFITNASLINENIVDKLSEFNTMFQITIDGHREKHNKVRIGKINNAPTYDTIIKAIHLITKKIIPEEGKKLLTLRINYDNKTLLNIDDIIEDIKMLDRKKVYIHLERVWQTRNSVDEQQVKLLKECIYKLAMNGFQVGHGNFGRKAVSCPAEVYQFAVINYNGLVYRCNGRTLTPESAEGKLLSSGEIEWDKVKLINRLSKTTFENDKCIKCVMLPKCLGPCSQKQMEIGWGNVDKICSMNSIDLPLKEHLVIDFEIKYMLEQIKDKSLFS